MFPSINSHAFAIGFAYLVGVVIFVAAIFLLDKAAEWVMSYVPPLPKQIVMPIWIVVTIAFFLACNTRIK